MLGRQHATVRRIRALRRDRGARDAEGVFLAEGVHLALEAVAARATVELALVSPRLDACREGAAIRDGLARAHVPIETTSDEILSTLQDARSAQPVVLVVRRAAAADPDPRSGPAVVACGVQDPGNLGALVRTAAAAGACALLACAPSADPYHPRAVRASAGAVFALPPIDAGPAAETLERLRRLGFVLVGTTATGAVPYDRFDWTRPIAVALGSEGGGLPDEVVARLDATVAIPMARGIESLSVGAAAAVVLFEAARRRGTAAAD